MVTNSAHVINNTIIDLTDEPEIIEDAAVVPTDITDYVGTRSVSSIELEKEFLSLEAEEPAVISLDDSDDDDRVSEKTSSMVEPSCSSKIVAKPVGCVPAIRTYVRPKTSGSFTRTAPEPFIPTTPIFYMAAPNIDLPLSTEDSSTSSDDIVMQRTTPVLSRSISDIDNPALRPLYSNGMEVDEDDDEVVGADENSADFGFNPSPSTSQQKILCRVPIANLDCTSLPRKSANVDSGTLPVKRVRFAEMRPRSKSVFIQKENIQHPYQNKKTQPVEKQRRKSTYDQSAVPAVPVEAAKPRCTMVRVDYNILAPETLLQDRPTGTDDQISLSIGVCPELRSCSDDVICSSGFTSSSSSLLRPHSDRDNNLCKHIDCVVNSSETETRDDLKVTHTVPVIKSDASDGTAVDDDYGLPNLKSIDPNESTNCAESKYTFSDELKSIVAELSIVIIDSGVDGTSDYTEPQLANIKSESTINPMDMLDASILETSITEHYALEDGSLNTNKISPKSILSNSEVAETLIANEIVEETPTIDNIPTHENDLPDILQPELTQEEEDALLNEESSLTDENIIDVECIPESETSQLAPQSFESSSISTQQVIEISSMDSASVATEVVCCEHSISSIVHDTLQDTVNQIDSEIYCNVETSIDLPYKQEINIQEAEEVNSQETEEASSQEAEETYSQEAEEANSQETEEVITQEAEEANTQTVEDTAAIYIKTDLIENAPHASEDLASKDVDLINENDSVNVEIVNIDSNTKEKWPCTENDRLILDDFSFNDYLPINQGSTEIVNTCHSSMHRTALETLAEAALNSSSSMLDITSINVSNDEFSREFYNVDCIEQQMEKIHCSSPAIPVENIPALKSHRRRHRSIRHHYTVDRPAETKVRIKKVPLMPHHYRSHSKGHSKRRDVVAAAAQTICEPAAADQSRSDCQYSQPGTLPVENLQSSNDQSMRTVSDIEYKHPMDGGQYFDCDDSSNQLLDLTSICTTGDALPSIKAQASDDFTENSLCIIDECTMDPYDMPSPSSLNNYANSTPNNCLSTGHSANFSNERRWYPDSHYRTASISPSDAANPYPVYNEPNLHSTSVMKNDFDEVVCHTNSTSTGEAVESDSRQSTIQLPIKKRVIPLPGTPVRPDQSYYDPSGMIYVPQPMTPASWYGNFSLIFHPAPQPPTTAVASSINYPAGPMLSIANLIDGGNLPPKQPPQRHMVNIPNLMDHNCNQANHIRCPGVMGNYMLPPSNEFHPNQATHHHYDNPTTSVDSTIKQDAVFMDNSNNHSSIPPSHPHLHGQTYKIAPTEQSHYLQNMSSPDEYTGTFQTEQTSSSSSSTTNVNAIQTSPMHQQPSYQSATTPQRPQPPIPDTIQVTQTFHANNFRSATTQDMLSINLQDYSVSREQVFNLLNNKYFNGERGESSSAMPSPPSRNCNSPSSRKRKGKHITNPQKRAKHEIQALEQQAPSEIPPLVRTKAARKVMNSGHHGRVTRSSIRNVQDDSNSVDFAWPSKKKSHSSKSHRK